VIRLPCEKDETDMLFAAKEGIRRGFKSFVIYGGTGGRIDHTLGTFAVMLHLVSSGAEVFAEDDAARYYMCGRGQICIPRCDGCGFSVVPYGGSAVVSIANAKYPLHEYELRCDDAIGISNEFLGGEAVITVSSGSALIVVMKSNPAG
jgi:thiamine pyrophosphokinase